MSDRLTVILIPPPTANGPLHLGHLSGPYLAADLVARAVRAGGADVIALGGVDLHQNYVLTRAEMDGVDVHDMVSAYRRRIDKALRLSRIGSDADIDPGDPVHQEAVATLAAALVDAGIIPMRPVRLHRCADCRRTLHHSYVTGACEACGSSASGGSCEGCGGYTCAQTLLDARCARCGGEPEPFDGVVPVLALGDVRDELLQVWAGASFPGRVRDLISRYLLSGLPDIPLAYPTDWGIAGSGPLAGLRLDVYFELGLSTALGVAGVAGVHVRDDPADLVDRTRAGLSRVDALWHVNGIDNAFAFAVLFPAVYLAAGFRPDQLAGAVVNEFYTLDGTKFSTSRNHAIWADDFLADEDADLVRLFLAWDRPDRSATDFTLAGYRAFCERARPLIGRERPASTTGIAHERWSAELDRALRALEPVAFDPASAARILLAALEAGVSHPSVDVLQDILTGHRAA